MINREFLNASHADLVAAILAEGAASARPAVLLEGGAAERTRIQGVLATALPGHEALVQKSGIRRQHHAGGSGAGGERSRARQACRPPGHRARTMRRPLRESQRAQRRPAAMP
jgi:hypothetical protein